MNTDLFGFGAIEAEFWRTVFLMTRIMAALVAAPLFGAMAIPVLVRLAMSGAIAVFVATNSSVGVPPDMFSIAGCVALAGEILVGLSLGFLLQLAFAAPVIAAEIISGAMGMSMAMAADPNGGSQITAIGQFFTIAITLVFLGMDGHLVWLRLLIASYDAFPPGEAWLRPDQSLAIAAFASQTFNAALLIALPIAFVLLLVQAVTGILSRSAPSLNLFALGLPAGVLAGIAALIIAAPALYAQLGEVGAGALERTAVWVAS